MDNVTWITFWEARDLNLWNGTLATDLLNSLFIGSPCQMSDEFLFLIRSCANVAYGFETCRFGSENVNLTQLHTTLCERTSFI